MTTNFSECDPPMDAHHAGEKLFLDTNRCTDEFLAMLGHEMRNPLSALTYVLQLWPLVKNDPEQMEKLRDTIQRQVRQLTRLSDDLLDIARITRGKLELHCEKLELQELIEDACEEIRPFIDRQHHELTVQMPAASILVYGDSSRLMQVFANLLQNAAKFTSKNGALCVTVELQEGMAQVRVGDNGPGIEEHMLPAIFEEFTQVQGTRAANDGLGLGLRLVKSIVELHGGAVAAHSEGLGHGSEFTVRLPAMNEAECGIRATREPTMQDAEQVGSGTRNCRIAHCSSS